MINEDSDWINRCRLGSENVHRLWFWCKGKRYRPMPPQVSYRQQIFMCLPVVIIKFLFYYFMYHMYHLYFLYIVCIATCTTVAVLVIILVLSILNWLIDYLKIKKLSCRTEATRGNSCRELSPLISFHVAPLIMHDDTQGRRQFRQLDDIL